MPVLVVLSATVELPEMLESIMLGSQDSLGKLLQFTKKILVVSIELTTFTALHTILCHMDHSSQDD